MIFKDREYYSTLFRIGFPITAQNFITSMLNVIDIAMIGQLGEVSIAAVGLANQIFFLLLLMLFGTNSGVGIFTAQLWGKRDVAAIRRVLGIGLIISLAGSFLFTLVALLFPGLALSYYTTDPAVISSGSFYLRIVGWAYMITAVTLAYSSVLRGTGYVRVPMVVSIGALSLKTVLNFGLIFGNFGFPALGIEGAALATVIARCVELIVMLLISYLKNLPPAAHISEMVGFKREFLVNVLKTSFPVLVNEVLWSFGITTYNMVYGRIGTDAIAAVNIAASIENLAFVIFIGISEGTGILIGHNIGSGHEEKAFDYGRKSLILATAGAIIGGLIIFSLAHPIMSFYKLSEAARTNAINILQVIGLVFWIRISNLVIVVGILRAGGDTRFGLFLDAGTVWLVGVPLAMLGGFVLHLPVHLVYLFIFTEEVLKYSVGLWRFRSRRWVNNLVQTG